MTQSGKPYNYLNRHQHKPGRLFARQLPDQTVHHPPGAMFILGGLGILFGFGANIWQLITTFTAFWTMSRKVLID